MARTVKVAVIGSGLAGLTSAWLLTRPLKDRNVEFEVHLFEKVCDMHFACSRNGADAG